MSKAQVALHNMRPPFLVLVPVCVALGAATAAFDGHALHWGYLLLALLGGLASHIAVNALNEYDDFRSGLDKSTTRTPFSGGSGSVPANPEHARVPLIVGLLAAKVTVLVGVFFVIQWGWAIVPLGLLGLLTIAAYTPWLTRSPLLCLIAPGLGFGPFMVAGTHFALTGQYSWTAWIASLVPFFLVSNLLLLNQFPDREADAGAGRRHLIIRRGLQAGVLTFGLFLLGAYVALVGAVLFRVLPPLGLLGLASLSLAVPVWMGVRQHHQSIPELIPVMGKNVMLTLAMPVLVAVGLFIAA